MCTMSKQLKLVGSAVWQNSLLVQVGKAVGVFKYNTNLVRGVVDYIKSVSRILSNLLVVAVFDSTPMTRFHRRLLVPRYKNSQSLKLTRSPMSLEKEER